MIGMRIKQARIAAQLSLRELAGKTGNYVSAQVIHKYELDKAIPGSDVLIKLAKALNVKIEYFFRPLKREVVLGEPAYRKRSTVSQKEILSIHEKTKEVVEKYLEVEELFPESRFKIEHPANSIKRPISSFEEIEEFAREVRKKWKLGIDPIVNLVEVLEERGVKVVMISSDDKIDGLSTWANDTLPIIVVKENQPSDRLRFSLAHELGHLLMDTMKSINPEKAADRFAGAFLVPKEAVTIEFGESRNRISIFELQTLRKKYGMSAQAWVYRLKDTGIINEQFYVRIWRVFNREKIFDKELGDPLVKERPKRLEWLVVQAAEERLISQPRAAELLGISLDNFRKEYSIGDTDAEVHS